jgi:hypothetical protein
MNDTFSNGKTDWHNWMRDTQKIDPSDTASIALVWKVVAQCSIERANVLAAKRRRSAGKEKV